MFKNITVLNKKVRNILVDLNKTGELPYIENDSDAAYALYFCCEKKLILNLFYNQNVNGNYIFQKSSNVRVSESGLRFIRDYSLGGRIVRTIFTILKGILGFAIGVVSTLLTYYLKNRFGL